MTVVPAVVNASVDIPTEIPLNPEPSPLNEVAVNCPVDELNERLDPVFGPIVPVAAVENIGKHVVSDDSSATVKDNAVEAVPVIAPAAAIAPAKNEVPPVTLRPALAVTTPTESTLTTSSYVNVPPILTFPLTLREESVPSYVIFGCAAV